MNATHRMSVNGNRFKMTAIQPGRGEYAGMRMNTGMNYPNPDAIEEFRFITNNYSAEFGKNPGGVMNVVTKSGTNTFTVRHRNSIATAPSPPATSSSRKSRHSTRISMDSAAADR